MIAKSTINEVHAISIEKVVGAEIDLKQKGADYKGVCPFHDDKLPSMSVSPTKEIYKCFACGAGGNGVSFVMDFHKLSYPEAIEYIAAKNNLVVEYDLSPSHLGEGRGEDKKQKADDRKLQEKILESTQRKYKEQFASYEDISTDFLINRGLKPEYAQYFQLGYALPGNTIRAVCVEKGITEHAAEIGILAKNATGTSYDIFQDRITIPIHNPHGQLLGFGGRTTIEHPAKYINSPDSWIYSKSKTLYNLHRAKKMIQKHNRTAYLTEGYMDVIGCHLIGIEQTVASCGTALTVEQATLLARFADNVVIFYDGDQAGRDATLKAAPVLLEAGLKVAVLNKMGQDPMDYAQSILGEEKVPKIVKREFGREQRHFLDWAYAYILAPQKEYIFTATKATRELMDKLGKQGKWLDLQKQLICTTNLPIEDLIPEGTKYKTDTPPVNNDERDELREKFLALIKLYDTTVQDEWLSKLASKNEWGIAKRVLADALKNSKSLKVEKPDRVLPEEVKSYPTDCDTEFYFKYKFAPKNDNTGYYFMSGGDFNEKCNCCIFPLFHLHGDAKKRYIEVRKKDQVLRVLIDNKALGTAAMLEQALIDFGGFSIDDLSKTEYTLLKRFLLDHFPPCHILSKLGYQRSGNFIAFSNMVYNGKLSNYDELGIYDNGTHKFLSPTMVKAIASEGELETSYEYDQYFEYKHSPVSLTEYFKLFNKVMKHHGPYGIAFKIMTLFRDIISQKAHIPFMYAFGQTNMGKSVFAESIMHFFLSGLDQNGKLIQPLQLNNTTDYALATLLETFQSCPIALNELDENSLSDQRMQAIKGTFDGIGRQKGKMTGGLLNQSPTCTVLLMGQYLFTKDGNSLVNRSIIRDFPARVYTVAEQQDYQQMKDYLHKGISSLVTDIQKHRGDFENAYAYNYQKTYKALKSRFAEQNAKVLTRLVDNYTHVYATLECMKNHIELPFDMKDFWEQLVADCVKHNHIIQSSDEVSDFWNYVVFMMSKDILTKGKELNLEAVKKIRTIQDNREEELVYDSPKNMLFVNANLIHPDYEKHSTNAMSLPNLRKYLAEMDSYIGYVKNYNYPGSPRTSAYVFDADQLPSEVVAYFVEEKQEVKPPEQTELTLWVSKQPERIRSGGADLLKYKASYREYPKPEVRYNCVTEDVSIENQLVYDAEVHATGIVTPKQMLKDGNVITWNEYLITKIHSIKAPKVQGEIALADTTQEEKEGDEPF